MAQSLAPTTLILKVTVVVFLTLVFNKKHLPSLALPTPNQTNCAGMMRGSKNVENLRFLFFCHSIFFIF